MASNFVEFYVQLVNKRTQSPIDDDTGLFSVLTAGTGSPATIYSSSAGTAIVYTAATLANTMTNGVIQFWVDSSVTTVDLCVVTASGQSVFISGLTKSQHRIEIDTEKIRNVMVVPFCLTAAGSLTATGSVWANGYSIPANSQVHDCFLRTSTLGTTALLNIGVSGTPSGYIIAGPVSATGYAFAEELLVSVTAILSRGALLMATAATSEFMRRSPIYSGVTAIVYNNTTSTTLVGAAGWIYIVYDKLPV
jgi:hypothetical protein